MPKTIAELTKNGKRRLVKKLYKAMRQRERSAQDALKRQGLQRLLALKDLLS